MKAKNLQVDKLSGFMYTRKMNKEGPSDDDGSAEKEEMIRRKLDELSPEDKNNEEMRDKIFNEVVGEDGHGRAFCMGVGIAPSSKRLKISSSSSQNNDSEIERLRQEAEERESFATKKRLIGCAQRQMRKSRKVTSTLST